MSILIKISNMSFVAACSSTKHQSAEQIFESREKTDMHL